MARATSNTALVIIQLGMHESFATQQPEEVGHQKSNLKAGQPKLAGSFVMTHRS